VENLGKNRLVINRVFILRIVFHHLPILFPKFSTGLSPEKGGFSTGLAIDFFAGRR
jgi:hypothetical protein